MRLNFLPALALGALLPVLASAGDNLSRGLWVGEVVLDKVNEVVVGIDSANHVSAPDPNVPTPTADKANLRLILHVDGEGNVRLLKSVAVLAKNTNRPPEIGLVTDETLYPNFSGLGRRIASAAFDFGEGKAADLLKYLAGTVANAAGSNTDSAAKAGEAASQVQLDADLDARYRAFAVGGILRTGALSAASSAGAAAAMAKSTNATAAKILELATVAATNELRLQAALTAAQAAAAATIFTDPRYVDAVFAVANAAAAGAAAVAATNTLPNLGAATAAARSGANVAALGALTAVLSLPSPVSAGYNAFITSPAFQTNGPLAAAAAAAGALDSRSHGGTVQEQVNRARAEALKALQQSRAFVAADSVPLREVNLSGHLTPSGVVTGQFYLGANHPTNPFRHRRHPDHTTGFDITRSLTLEIGTNGFQHAGFGVDQLSGIYKEEITGLHKPLGPMQNIGLKTEGTFTLNRISLVDALNQYP